MNRRHSIPAAGEWPNKEFVIRSMHISHYYPTHHMSDESDVEKSLLRSHHKQWKLRFLVDSCTCCTTECRPRAMVTLMAMLQRRQVRVCFPWSSSYYSSLQDLTGFHLTKSDCQTPALSEVSPFRVGHGLWLQKIKSWLHYKCFMFVSHLFPLILT